MRTGKETARPTFRYGPAMGVSLPASWSRFLHSQYRQKPLPLSLKLKAAGAGRRGGAGAAEQTLGDLDAKVAVTL
jgi:hypothetical protein